MARRGMTGQLNMFDFFRELETNIPQDGELEMVSLMPSFDEEQEVSPRAVAAKSKKTGINTSAKTSTKTVIKEKPVSQQEKNVKKDCPVMQRTYTTKQGIVEIAYMNYSKVRVTEPGQEVQIKEFASSKEAVDYYVEQMQKLEELYTRDN